MLQEDLGHTDEDDSSLSPRAEKTINYRCQEVISQSLLPEGSKKVHPVSDVLMQANTGRCVVLCNNHIFVLNMYTLQVELSGLTSNVLKGVNLVRRDAGTSIRYSDGLQFSVVRKKTCTNYTLTADQLVNHGEFSLPDTPIDMVRRDKEIAMVSSTAFYIVRTETGVVNKILVDYKPIKDFAGHCAFLGPRREYLFRCRKKYDDTEHKEELLVNVNDQGRLLLNIAFAHSPRSLIYVHPYLYASYPDDGGVKIINLADKRVVQTLSVSRPSLMLPSADRLDLLVTNRNVYMISQESARIQIESVRDQGHLLEAQTLARSLLLDNAGEFDPIQRQQYCMEVSKIGMYAIDNDRYDEAITFLLDAEDVDVRNFFPFLGLPLYTNTRFRPLPDSSFTKRRAKILEEENPEKERKAAFQSLLEMLVVSARDRARKKSRNDDEVTDLNHALVIIYAQEGSNRTQLLDFLDSEVRNIDASWCTEKLLSMERYRAAAQLMIASGFLPRAISLWQQVEDQSPESEEFEYLTEYMLPYVSEMPLNDDYWSLCEWFLQRNVELGVHLLVLKEHEDGLVNDSDSGRNWLTEKQICRFLGDFGADAMILYLLHAVDENDSKEPFVHTKLAELLINHCAHDCTHDPGQCPYKKQLTALIRTSKLYKLDKILALIEGTDLHAEKAYVLWQVGEFEKAFRTIVAGGGDWQMAEELCRIDSDSKQHNLNVLLTVLLEDPVANAEGIKQVLGRNSGAFEVDEVLEKLPGEWSLFMISDYLNQVWTAQTSLERQNQVQRKLLEGEAQQSGMRAYRLGTTMEYVSDMRACDLCHRALRDGPILRYPNGTLVHKGCSKDISVCPVTKTDFRSGASAG
eukprot:Clim_evm23s141 gene=Clim_evmTU23s141